MSGQTIGDSHPHTLASMNSMAGLFKAQGRYNEAESLYAECLLVMRETLGDRHPDTLEAVISMADSFKVQVRYDEAEPFYVECLHVRRVTLGDRHPSTLTSSGRHLGTRTQKLRLRCITIWTC